MKTSKTKRMILCAFFGALTAVGTMISIPLPFSPVPINLALFSVFLSGVLLGAKDGAISQIVYIFLGLIGLPVFSNFSAGPGVLAGPTGGYIIGYILAAYTAGLLASGSSYSAFRRIMGLIAALAACYIPGTLWFMFSTKTGLIPALTMCVIPFLPGDAIKILVTALLSKKLLPIIKRF